MRRTQPTSKSKPATRNRRPQQLALAAVATMAAIAFIVCAVVDQPAPSGSPAAPANSIPAPAAAGTADNTPSEFDSLKGQWQRPDGGYILNLKHIEANGATTAEYFNPRPIRIARAEAQRSEGKSTLFVELRDEGYPGCTYRLTYDPDRDELAGTYFQAALSEEFEVVFVRVK